MMKDSVCRGERLKGYWQGWVRTPPYIARSAPHLQTRSAPPHACFPGAQTTLVSQLSGARRGRKWVWKVVNIGIEGGPLLGQNG